MNIRTNYRMNIFFVCLVALGQSVSGIYAMRTSTQHNAAPEAIPVDKHTHEKIFVEIPQDELMDVVDIALFPPIVQADIRSNQQQGQRFFDRTLDSITRGVGVAATSGMASALLAGVLAAKWYTVTPGARLYMLGGICGTVLLSMQQLWQAYTNKQGIRTMFCQAILLSDYNTALCEHLRDRHAQELANAEARVNRAYEDNVRMHMDVQLAQRALQQGLLLECARRDGVIADLRRQLDEAPTQAGSDVDCAASQSRGARHDIEYIMD